MRQSELPCHVLGLSQNWVSGSRGPLDLGFCVGREQGYLLLSWKEKLLQNGARWVRKD